MKLAVVVQRYGPAIHGGAELHARYIAEHLAQHTEIEVLTTCASSDLTWANEFKAGVETINRVPVRRFRVSRSRKPRESARLSALVFREQHSIADELKWLDAEGPASPALVRYLRKHGDSYDFFLFFSYRFYHAFHGARAVASKAILVPASDGAAGNDALGLRVFRDVFRGVRALLYNSPEERSLIQGITANQQVPAAVVGAGADVPANPQPGRFKQKHNIRGPFALYVGRIDSDGGAGELLKFFQQYLKDPDGSLSLVLVGDAQSAVPDHPRITHLSSLGESDRFDAVAGAEAVIVPSAYEGFSRSALEAWSLGKPVLANGKSNGIKGLCLRSNGGLLYRNSEEFSGMLLAMEQHRWISGSLGKNGRQYVRDNYDWRIIERKYHDMLTQLQKAPATQVMEPLPGWSARRRRDVPPAAEVLRGRS